MPRKLEEEEMQRRIARFKELVKQGYSVRKAQKESKLQPRDYKRFYDEIWSDPDTAPFKPERAKRKEVISPPVMEVEKGLKKYVEEGKTPFERELEEFEQKRRTMLDAARKVMERYSRIKGIVEVDLEKAAEWSIDSFVSGIFLGIYLASSKSPTLEPLKKMAREQIIEMMKKGLKIAKKA